MASDGLQQTALDHLWLHFTQMGGYADPAELQVIVQRRRLLPRGLERQALPRRPRRALLREHRLRLRRRDGRGGRRADARAAVRDQLDLRPPPLDRARRGAGRRSLRATSTAPSSSPAGRRPPRRPGSSPASTTAPAASGAGRRSPAGWPTTAPPWARSRSRAAPSCARPFEPLVPDVLHVSNTNRYHRPPEETEEEFTRVPPRRARGHDRPGRARHRRDGDHGAGPERGRLVHPAGRVLRGRPRALRRARHPALRRRGDHRLRAHRVTGSPRSATTSGPT